MRCVLLVLAASLTLGLLSVPSAQGQSADASARGADPPAWQRQAPAQYGFDAERLGRAYAYADTLAPLNSLLVWRDTLVAAQYFRDLAPGEAVNMKSASKSVLSLLVGIALEEGHLDSLRQPIGPFFPEVLEGAPRKQQITLRDLLTMRAGLESTSFGNYGAWVTSDNWVRDALERPLIRPPGQGEMIYSTGTSHLVAVILAKAVGRPLRAYAQAKLFDPLGVTIRSWQQDPQGYYFGGNNMALTPTALLRVGRLIAQEGRFQGRQVIPADWIERATRTYVTKTYRDFKYGYFWWIENFAARRVVFAWGYGGQFVFIVPEIDLVIACTSSLTNRPPGTGDHTGRVFRMLEDAVLPAVQAPVGGGVR